MDSYSKPRSIHSLMRDIKKGKIVLDTSIQRKENQWNRKKKSLLILSGIQGIIIPPIFTRMTQDEKGKEIFEVLDGKQRLTTFKAFTDDEFALDKSLPEEYANKKFSQLDKDTQYAISDVEISVNVYQNITEEETETIFCRLNNGQKLSNDNLLRAHMGAKLRAFIDEAIAKPFIEKTALTKGQLTKSEDQGVILTALSLIADCGTTSFSKECLTAFVDEFKENYNEENVQSILNALDWLDSIFEEKNKNLKKISLPMIIAVAADCDESKKDVYADNLKAFLEDYENRTDYLQYCSKATTSAVNVAARLEYFKRMAE